MADIPANHENAKDFIPPRPEGYGEQAPSPRAYWAEHDKAAAPAPTRAPRGKPKPKRTATAEASVTPPPADTGQEG